MRFFSFDLETEVMRPEIGVGRESVHDWDGARGGAAFLFLTATEAEGVEKDSVSLDCLTHCLVWDLFLMTKELCSLLLSPCSNNVLHGRGGHIT